MKRESVRDALVSVIIPTYNRPELLTQRAIPSVLAQTHRNFDLHVVGDGAGPEVVAAMATVTDRRVRFTNRPRPIYPPGELDAWHTSGSHAFNYGLNTARGQFVCGLGDDDSYEPEYIEALLDGLTEQKVGLIYCISRVVRPDGGPSGYLGCDFPPQFSHQSGGEFLWRKNDIRLDAECWRRGLPNDWDYIERTMRSGVKVGRVPRVLYNYFPSKHVPGGYLAPF
jgi:glycosyltransferase involved in cell wall biosynthesis